MLRKTPESFNAVDMILAMIGQGLRVIQTMVLAPATKGVVAPEGVGVIDRPLSGVFPDMGHELIGSHSFHHLGIHPAVALQKPEYNAFSGSPSAALPFPPAAKVGIVNLNLAFELAGLKLGHMVDRLSQALVDAAHRLIVKPEVHADAIGRLLLIKPGEDGHFSAQPFQRLLLSAGFASAPHIPAASATDLERTAEKALSASQKVGRTVENVLFASNHEGILAPRGYESH